MNSNPGNRVFVFGSNLAGRHGRGSAKEAFEKHGAKYGVGNGLCGHSYAIPTKDESLRVLSLEHIEIYVKEFLEFAASNRDIKFDVVKIGCGLSGYSESEISPMFQGSSDNVCLPKGWTR